MIFKKRYEDYKAPELSLLGEIDESEPMTEDEVYALSDKVCGAVKARGMDIDMFAYSIGPSYTELYLAPEGNEDAVRITHYDMDIEIVLDRNITFTPSPYSNSVCLQIPNEKRRVSCLRQGLESEAFKRRKDSPLAFAAGERACGEYVVSELDELPHMLIAGRAGSGKSCFLDALITTLALNNSPDRLRIVLIDPKNVEFTHWGRIPHLALPIIGDPKLAVAAFNMLVNEMERRYGVLAGAQVRNIKEYEKLDNAETMPRIVVIIDELADLMLQVRDPIEERINCLAAKARACGIYLVISTQRASTDVVTGLIKANIPSRMCFALCDTIGSRIMLGTRGAEDLTRGEAIFCPTGGRPVRVQSLFQPQAGLNAVIDAIVRDNGEVFFEPENIFELERFKDEAERSGGRAAEDTRTADEILFEQICKAVEVMLETGKATTNLIQRFLKIGFNRAANIMDKLEELGFVSPTEGGKPRRVLVTEEQYLEWKEAQEN